MILLMIYNKIFYIIMGSNFLLIRYGDLTDPSPNMFKNYKILKDHTIIPLI